MNKYIIFIFSIIGLCALEGNAIMAYTQISLPEIKVIGIQVRTMNENLQCLQDMNALWTRFFTENLFAKIPNVIDSSLFGVYTDYEKDFTAPYSYTVGCQVDSLDMIPEGMVGIIIPAQAYAQFEAKATQQVDLKNAIGATWGQIWQTPLARSYSTDFEFYPNCLENVEKPQFEIAEVFISIK